MFQNQQPVLLRGYRLLVLALAVLAFLASGHDVDILGAILIGMVAFALLLMDAQELGMVAQKQKKEAVPSIDQWRRQQRLSTSGETHDHKGNTP